MSINANIFRTRLPVTNQPPPQKLESAWSIVIGSGIRWSGFPVVAQPAYGDPCGKYQSADIPIATVGQARRSPVVGVPQTSDEGDLRGTFRIWFPKEDSEEPIRLVPVPRLAGAKKRKEISHPRISRFDISSSPQRMVDIPWERPVAHSSEACFIDCNLGSKAKASRNNAVQLSHSQGRHLYWNNLEDRSQQFMR